MPPTTKETRKGSERAEADLEHLSTVGKLRKRYRPVAKKLIKRYGTKAVVLDVKHEDVPVAYIEKGSFSHAVCPSCDWEGPARRARDKARHDAEEHTVSCKKVRPLIAKL